MATQQTIERVGQQAQTYGRTAITYGRRASSIALSKLSTGFDIASVKSSEYSKQVDADSTKGKAAKITGTLLTGAAIAAAAGGSWLMRHNQTKATARDGLPAEPYGDGADMEEPLVHTAPITSETPAGADASIGEAPLVSRQDSF